MEVWTTAIALSALLLSVASILWQWKMHRDAGVRVKISFVLNLADRDSSTSPIGKSGAIVRALPDEHLSLGVVVHNIGRQNAIVTSLTFGTSDAPGIVSDVQGFPVPILVSGQRSWIIDEKRVRNLIRANQGALEPRKDLVAVLTLGNDTVVRARVSIKAVEAAFTRIHVTDNDTLSW